MNILRSLFVLFSFFSLTTSATVINYNAAYDDSGSADNIVFNLNQALISENELIQKVEITFLDFEYRMDTQNFHLTNSFLPGALSDLINTTQILQASANDFTYIFTDFNDIKIGSLWTLYLDGPHIDTSFNYKVAITTVPEPQTILLLTFGLFGLFGLLQLKRRAN